MPNYVRAGCYLLAMMRHVYWSPAKLANFRNRQVKEIISYAYDNVAFYHELFRKYSIKPHNVTSVEDLNRIPILQKAEIRKEIEKTVSAEFDIAHLKKVETSGSTGKPFTVYITSEEDEIRKARRLRANMIVGQRPFDRWLIMQNPLRSEPPSKLQRFSRFFNYTSVSLFEDVGTQLAVIRRTKPEVLEGFSNSIYMVAQEAKKRDITDIRPKLVVGGAELVSDFSRRVIENAFNASYYDQYATNEFERLAWQCKEKVGYHIDADSVVMQFVDKQGEEVAPGERGEVVCTSLFNHAMPLIRFAIGDVGVPSDEKTCPCGKTFPLMKILEGRKNSFITLPDGRKLPPVAFFITVDKSRFRDHIDQFRIIQRKLDDFEIQIKLADHDVPEGLIAKDVLQNLRGTLGPLAGQLAFNFDFLDELPLEKTGKLRAVISEVES